MRILITLLAANVLYFSLYRPMVGHIRERVRAEDALQRTNEQLEERVAERTTELESTVQKLKEEIEERRRVQGDLTKTNDFVRSVVESVPFILLIFEVGTKRSIFANCRLEEYLGLTPEDVCTRGEGFLKTLLDPKDYESFDASDLEMSLGSSVGISMQPMSLRDANGKSRRFQVTLAPLTRLGADAAGEMLFVAIPGE